MVAAVPGGVTGAKMRASRFGDGDDPNLKDFLKLDIPFNKLVTVNAVGAAVGFGSTLLAALPKGELFYLPSVLYIEFSEEPKTTNISETWSGDFSVGFTPTADVTITDNADFLASTALNVATAGNFARARFALTLLNNTFIDNNDGAKGVWLNLLIDAADIADGTTPTVRVRGGLKMAFIPYGKNVFP